MRDENDSQNLVRFAISMIVLSHAISFLLWAPLFREHVSVGFIEIKVLAQTIYSIAQVFFIPYFFTQIGRTFGGETTSIHALKLYLFFATPLWVFVAITAIPLIGFSYYGALVFSFYQLWKRYREALGPAEEKKILCFINIVLLVLGLAIFGAYITNWVAWFGEPRMHNVFAR